MPDEVWIAVTLTNLGLVVARSGDPVTGMRYLEEGLARHRAQGHQFGAALSRRFLGQVVRDSGDDERAAQLFAESLAVDVDLAQQWHITGALEGLAGIYARAGRAELAATIFGAAEAIREEIGVPLEPALRPAYDRDVAGLRAALSPSSLDDAWAAGRSLPLERIIAMAVASARQKPAAPVKKGDSLLSRREREIMLLLADGRSSREIADVLFISPRTAATHVSNILTKLNVDSRAAAVAIALRQHMI